MRYWDDVSVRTPYSIFVLGTGTFGDDATHFHGYPLLQDPAQFEITFVGVMRGGSGYHKID